MKTKKTIAMILMMLMVSSIMAPISVQAATAPSCVNSSSCKTHPNGHVPAVYYTAPRSEPTIGDGKSNPSHIVARCQTMLYNLGYTSVGNPDGLWGTNTRNAVLQFQEKYKSTLGAPDGLVGTKTWNKLYDLANPRTLVIKTANFNQSEWKCSHCSALPEWGIHKKLLEQLETLRTKLGNKALVIDSGYRCAERNQIRRNSDNEVSLTSNHMLGTAADIRYTTAPTLVSCNEIATKAKTIFVAPRGSVLTYSTFRVHVDIK